MKIDTLIDDVYKTLEEGVDVEDIGTYGKEYTEVLRQRLAPKGEQGPDTLRLSSIGKPCARQLWYGTHAHVHREPLLSHTRLKFLYGDLVEQMLLTLVKKSGHLVEGEQDTILVNGIKGHRDCVIDGMLCDVKSASSFSFKKFKGGLQSEDDSFGYLTQLGSYLLGSREDPCITYKNEAAFLVVDKVTGHLCLDRHTFTEEGFGRIKETLQSRKDALQKKEAPEKAFDPIPEGKSGNLKLGVNCSYCSFKAYCWPNLRTFLYSGNRPVFLTHVEREPNVPELKDN